MGDTETVALRAAGAAMKYGLGVVKANLERIKHECRNAPGGLSRPHTVEIAGELDEITDNLGAIAHAAGRIGETATNPVPEPIPYPPDWRRSLKAAGSVAG